MNKVILMGRLTKDAMTSTYNTADGTGTTARFTLAVDRRKKGENNADFISCVAFGKTAEFIDKYAKQGTKLVVEGRIQTGSFTNKDGNKVYTTDVVIENAEFAESKKTDTTQKADADGFMQINESLEGDGLPFN